MYWMFAPTVKVFRVVWKKEISINIVYRHLVQVLQSEQQINETKVYRLLSGQNFLF